jgi:hypothetical protein
MKTESGAQSVGSANSAARFNSEALHAIETQYQALLLTSEGREMLSRFGQSVGCDFDAMTNKEASNWINCEYKSLFSFLCGATFLFSKL